MSIAVSTQSSVRTRSGRYLLADFDRQFAALVASWVRDDHELFWLAPKTAPPLTTEKVIAWPGADGCPLLFYRQGTAEPCGYLELNPMPASRDHLWLGHCLIRPGLRGVGLGHLIVRLMLDEAFVEREASSVSLVVFPRNDPAVRCYLANGFVHVGEQVKFFSTTGRRHRMLEMKITRGRYIERLTQ
ncbi:MAG TPA: GNAT family N-acetyltransferase [Phycisphaerae bacterium]|nr:GNAT family N-acetyltransferase [Phycisphaerae bacterium]HRY69385.1 GNAT family N-acetyltransferase [Phycisphaerae bacterium]HSA26252.1 GNAT family N-acetyltransferase [Phycisphaerae bacterium]